MHNQWPVTTTQSFKLIFGWCICLASILIIKFSVSCHQQILKYNLNTRKKFCTELPSSCKTLPRKWMRTVCRLLHNWEDLSFVNINLLHFILRRQNWARYIISISAVMDYLLWELMAFDSTRVLKGESFIWDCIVLQQTLNVIWFPSMLAPLGAGQCHSCCPTNSPSGCLFRPLKKLLAYRLSTALLPLYVVCLSYN